MRNSITMLTLALLFMACSSTKSQTVKKPKATFETQLSSTLDAINNAEGVTAIFENKNKLKRLSSMYPNEWLSDYYVTLLNIKLSLGVKEASKKEALLNEAKENLKVLKEKENSNESEVLTLEGYYYYAKIASNPQKNGQLYYMEVIGAYQKAIAIDKSNPRPILMLSIFQNDMASFTGAKITNFCEKLTQIEQMLEHSKQEKVNDPKWGIRELKRSQKMGCS